MWPAITAAGFVGLVYRFIYLRPQKAVEVAKEEPVRVLVVDDDPDFVQVARTILSKEGFKVSSASNGDQALQAMKEKRPNLVLLDVMMAMPLEGVRAARKMWADPVLNNTKDKMLSSIGSSENPDRPADHVHLPY